MSYDGPSSAGTWLEEGVELALEYSLVTAEDRTIQIAMVDGSVANLTGEISTVAFSTVTFSTVETNCPAEPGGTIALRDAVGVWVDVVFDVEGGVSEGWTAAEGTCDGCGAIWFDGNVIGEACIQMSNLHDSTIPPW